MDLHDGEGEGEVPLTLCLNLLEGILDRMQLATYLSKRYRSSLDTLIPQDRAELIQGVVSKILIYPRKVQVEYRLSRELGAQEVDDGKLDCNQLGLSHGAEGEGRTLTGLPPPAPKAGASAIPPPRHAGILPFPC